MTDKERMHILGMIENGELSPEEGAEQLANVGKQAASGISDKNETMQVLEMVERGELSPNEAVNRFQAEADPDDSPRIRHIRDEEAARDFQDHSRVKRWQNWWTLPLWLGVGITVLGSYWMYSTLQSSGAGFWFFSSFVVFLLGVAVIALAWASRSSPWLHVRVRKSSKTEDSKVKVSIPLPIRPAAWVLHNFGNMVPSMDQTIIDELIAALDKEKTDGKPFYIEVEDEEDGEHVEVFIG